MSAATRQIQEQGTHSPHLQLSPLLACLREIRYGLRCKEHPALARHGPVSTTTNPAFLVHTSPTTLECHRQLQDHGLKSHWWNMSPPTTAMHTFRCGHQAPHPRSGCLPSATVRQTTITTQRALITTSTGDLTRPASIASGCVHRPLPAPVQAIPQASVKSTHSLLPSGRLHSGRRSTSTAMS